MPAVDVFSTRDLRKRAGGLIRDAEAGKLALITKYGRPTALAVPFDEELLELGVHRQLAARLYAERLLTLAKAAKLAGLSIEAFLDVLQVAGVDVVDYPPEELDAELEALR